MQKLLPFGATQSLRLKPLLSIITGKLNKKCWKEFIPY